MRLPFKGLYIFTQDYGVNPQDYAQFLVLYPDGIRRPMKGHNGLDFGTPHRTELVAPHSGTVIEANFDRDGYGNYVKIESEEEGSVIAHLDVIDVKAGYQLAEGDHIGWSDSTGNSTGPHCHWGYYRFPRDRSNGIAGFIDQKPYLEQAGIFLPAVGQLPEIRGQAAQQLANGEIDYKGLDPNNKESLQVAINTWYNVAHGKYKTVEEFQALEQQLDEVKKQLGDTQQSDATVSSDLKNYNGFKALGYNTVDDLNKKLTEKDTAVFSLSQENTKLLKRIDVLAGEIQSSAQEDHTTADLGHSLIDENQKLKDTIQEIAKVAGVDKPTLRNIVAKVFDFKDMAERFIQRSIEEEEKRKVTKTAVKSDNIKTVEESGTSFLMRLFQLFPTEGGEKT